MKFDWDWIPGIAYALSYGTVVVLFLAMAISELYQLIDYLISSAIQIMCGLL